MGAALRAREGERRRGGHAEPPRDRGARLATLTELGIETRFVSTSPIKIAFYVPRDDVERAVTALHETFELSRPEAERQHA